MHVCRSNSAKKISKKHGKGMRVHVQISEHAKAVIVSGCLVLLLLNWFEAIEREVVCVQSTNDNKATLNYLSVNSHLQMCSCLEFS